MTKKRRIGLANFRKHKDEIREMYVQGYPIIYIYEHFSEKVDLKRTRFYELMNKEIIDDNKTEKAKYKNKSVQQKNSQQISPKREKTDPFRQKKEPIHNPTMTDERRKELF
ncbi:hypothetical protein WAX86_20230 (plasmid) [Photobacterium damselae subsp. damselae]|uniref:hypothetical protein n=1 Tax=Photobacterium damselae TaxID=38293 RepID=UPI00311AD521